HLLDAMRGIGKLPGGCAEQITSTSFVSLMALQLLQKDVRDKAAPSNPRSVLAAEARTALQQGYDQLIGIQDSEGGFAYWNGRPSDVAVTAYVLRFLNLAGEFIEVDPAIRMKARDYLLARETQSG